MTERIMILAVGAVLGITLCALFRHWQLWRATRIAAADPLLQGRRPGIPAIVYFTTPTCAPCQTQQRPALRRLLEEMGETVQIIEINAQEQTDAADRWGVLSVPTTFILDRQGRPQTINYGVAGVEKLKQQLRGL
jgi:thioredoxin-like negative regulator of GroEL